MGIIKQTDAGVRRMPGTKLATSTGDIIYTPPEGEERLRDLLGNLERFLYAEDDLDPLVRMAVMHYQLCISSTIRFSGSFLNRLNLHGVFNMKGGYVKRATIFAR
ncbi:MAG TPA: hypothetical protein VF613_17615 [Longimicrobium sp.]